MIGGDLFTGKLVRLAASRPEDKEKLALWTNDSEYLRLLDDDPAIPRNVDYFSEQEKKPREGNNSFHFHIRTLEDDKLIGFTSIWVSWTNQVGWFGIGIGDPDYRGKGYGSDAISVLMRYAFHELNLHRLTLGVFSYNTRAIRAYTKLGFVEEGRLREALFRDGKRHDILHMGLLRRDWEAQQELEGL